MFIGLLAPFVPPAAARKRRAIATPPATVAHEWLRLGVRAALDGQREEARYYFVQAVRSDLENPRAWLYLGGVADDPALTLSCMQKVLQLDSCHKEAREGLLWARTRLGLIAPSAPAAPALAPAPAVPATPAQPGAPAPPRTSADLVDRGLGAAREGDRARARYYFMQAIALDSHNIRAWLYLGGVAGDPAITLAALERVLAAEPRHPAAYRGVLWARNKLGLTVYGPHWWQR